MFFRQIIHTEKSCLSYLIGCQSAGLCAVIDPQGDPEVYLQAVEENGMRLSLIIDTHNHFDHTSTANELHLKTGSPVYCGISNPDRNGYEALFDDQIIEVGNRRLRVLHTPGHTLEHICLLGDEWYLVTGDLLFVGDVGRIDLADALPKKEKIERSEMLYTSLHRLLLLPDWIEVFPGHFSGSICGRDLDGKMISTIGRERRKNRALNLSREEFINFQLANPVSYEIKTHSHHQY